MCVTSHEAGRAVRHGGYGLGAGREEAAAQAAYFGKRVAVVEHAPVPGGEMVSGAITTKAMREAALYLTGSPATRSTASASTSTHRQRLTGFAPVPLESRR